MKINTPDKRVIFSTGTSISGSRAWFLSLGGQIAEYFRERRNTSPRAIITAKPDPNALQRLVNPPSQTTSLLTLVRDNIRDIVHPRRIELTSTPVKVRDIWSKNENHVPGLLSILAHVSVITALIVFSVVSNTMRKPAVEGAVSSEPIVLSLPPSTKPGGGGGGGTRSPIPASKGVLPRVSDKQFVPPTPLIINMAPELMAEPTIVAFLPASLPRVSNVLPLGDPHGVNGPPSSGKGIGGGIGDEGDGHGVGNFNGPGGPGCCGGPGDGVPTLRANGPGVTNPSCPVQIEPNYSDDARRAGIQGTVLLAVTVQKDGSIEPDKVIKGLGYGLDDEAKRVLNKWKCNPGRFNGQAVAIPIQIQINFHLY